MSVEDVDSPKNSREKVPLGSNSSLLVAKKIQILERQRSPRSEPTTPTSAQLDYVDSWFNIGFGVLKDRNRNANIMVKNNKKIAAVANPLCRKYRRIKQLVKQREAGWRLLHNQVSLIPELLNMVQNCERRMEVMITNLDKIEKMCKRRRLSQHDKALLQIDSTIEKKINQYKRKRDKELSVARSRLKKQQESLDFKKRREKAIRDSKGAPASKLEFGKMFFKTTTVPRTAKTLEAEANNPNDNKNSTKISFTLINEEKSSEANNIKPLSVSPAQKTSPLREEKVDQSQSEETVSIISSNLGKPEAGLPSDGICSPPIEIPVKPETIIENKEAREDNEDSDEGNNQNILGDFWGGSTEPSWTSQREVKNASGSDAEVWGKNEPREESIQSTEGRSASTSLCALKEYLSHGGWEKYLDLFLRASWRKDKLERCQIAGDLIMIGVLPQDAKLMIEWLRKQRDDNLLINRNLTPVGMASPKEPSVESEEALATSSTSECKQPLKEKLPLKETPISVGTRGDSVDHASGEDDQSKDADSSRLYGSELTDEQKIETTGISEVPIKFDDETQGSPALNAVVADILDNASDGSSGQRSMSSELIKITDLDENLIPKVVD